MTAWPPLLPYAVHTPLQSYVFFLKGKHVFSFFHVFGVLLSIVQNIILLLCKKTFRQKKVSNFCTNREKVVFLHSHYAHISRRCAILCAIHPHSSDMSYTNPILALEKQKQLLHLSYKWVDEGLFKDGFYHGDLHAGNIMIDTRKGAEKNSGLSLTIIESYLSS